jgi:hypothetical protein
MCYIDHDILLGEELFRVSLARDKVTDSCAGQVLSYNG